MTAAFGCTREASGDAPCKTWCKSKDCVRSEAGWPTDADYESLWSIAAEIAKDRHRPARLIFGALVAEHIAQRTAQQAAQPQRAEQAAQPVAWYSVIAERQRQIESEGWTARHDDDHSDGSMALAAACYALNAATWAAKGTAELRQSYADLSPGARWPWKRKWWKPKSQRQDLVRAGALILAEIERLDRANPAYAAQPQQAAQPVAQEPRVCWLIEEFSDSGNSTGRYMQDQNDLTITTDAQKARQFLRSRTATFRATDMREKWGTSWRPVSHVFRAAQPQQAAQPVAPVGWLYDWTHSSATGRPDERFTSFTADEVYAFKGMGHENVRPVYAAAQPQQATEGSRLSDLHGLLADAQPKQPNGQA